MSEMRKQPQSCMFSWSLAAWGNFFLKIKLSTLTHVEGGLLLFSEGWQDPRQQAGSVPSQKAGVVGQAGVPLLEGFLRGLPLVNLISHQPGPRGRDWIASGTSETSTSGVGL